MLLAGLLWIARTLIPILSVASLPSAKDYMHLLKNLLASRHSTSDSKIHFTKAMLTLGEQSLNQNGVGYCWLPVAGHIFILSKPQHIEALYNQPGSVFSQISFFERLAVVLGTGNLMSSEVHSATHSTLRQAILNRNKQFLQHLPQIVHDFFEKYRKQPPQPLTEVMEKLSRAVLLSAYFEKNIVNRFEKKYATVTNLTEDLLSLIELEMLSHKKHNDLLAVRERLFAFGYGLLCVPNQPDAVFSWLTLLLKVRVQQHVKICRDMHILLQKTEEPGQWPSLSSYDWQQLLSYARVHGDKTPLSTSLRDTVNESIFIPLLGFDATATMLCTTIRIIMENPRIKVQVKEEMRLLKTTTPKLSSHMGYLDAVMQEALRLFPPTPLIPEIVTARFSIPCNGRILTFPKQAMILIPLELLHRYPPIELTPKEQQQFDQILINSGTVFPERYNPRKPDGELFHMRLYPSLPDYSFFSFKGKKPAAKRRCPGSSLALSEGTQVMHELLDKGDFTLLDHQPLTFFNDYEKSIQRSQGGGLLALATPKLNLEPT